MRVIFQRLDGRSVEIDWDKPLPFCFVDDYTCIVYKLEGANLEETIYKEVSSDWIGPLFQE